MSVAVGADVESICSKCGDVWHVVVAKVEDKIAKVECKECGALHRYRPTSGTGAKKAAPKKRTTKKKTEPPPEVPLVEPDPNKPIQAYQVSATFEVGDQINHVKFGVGVVEMVMSGKVQVWFPDGRKVLACAKPSATLPAGGRARPLTADS